MVGLRNSHAKRDLPGLVAGVIEPLGEQRKLQHQKFERYRGAILTDKDADHAIMQMYRMGVVNVTRIAAVLQEWDEPSFDEFRAEPRSAWRLFNATTFALTGRVAENPAATEQLHTILEGTCCVVE